MGILFHLFRFLRGNAPHMIASRRARNRSNSLPAKENGHVARGFVVQRETGRRASKRVRPRLPTPPCRGGGRAEDRVLSRNDLQRKASPVVHLFVAKLPRRLWPAGPIRPGAKTLPGLAIGIPYAHQVVEGLAHSLQPGSSRTAHVASIAGVGHRDQLRVRSSGASQGMRALGAVRLSRASSSASTRREAIKAHARAQGRDPNRDREGWLHLCRRLPQGGHLNKHVPTVETEGPGARTGGNIRIFRTS